METEYKIGDFYHDNELGLCVVKEVFFNNKIKISYFNQTKTIIITKWKHKTKTGIY